MEFKPKDQLIETFDNLKIFLAGTIDNGASVDWQTKTVNHIHERLGNDVHIYNPRNSDWNPELLPELSVPEFRKQVQWEYRGLCLADEIIMCFLPNSKSPITLMELGWFASSGKISVICPKDFYRKGNVDFICEVEGIPQYNTIEDAVRMIKKRNKCTLLQQ